MKELPLVCKYTRNYFYRGSYKEKPIYAVLLEYNSRTKCYYANLINENGTLFGRHYDRWLDWDDEVISSHQVSMEHLPKKVLKTVTEQVEVFEEVNRRTKRK